MSIVSSDIEVHLARLLINELFETQQKERTDREQQTKWEPCQILLRPAAHRATIDY